MNVIKKYQTYKKLWHKQYFLQKYTNLFLPANIYTFSLENINGFEQLLDSNIKIINDITINWLLLGVNGSRDELERFNTFLKDTNIVYHSIDKVCIDDNNNQLDIARRDHKYICYKMNLNDESWDDIITENNKYNVISYDRGVVHLSGQPHMSLYHNIKNKLKIYGRFYCPVQANIRIITARRIGPNISYDELDRINLVDGTAIMNGKFEKDIVMYNHLNFIIDDYYKMSNTLWRHAEPPRPFLKYQDFKFEFENVHSKEQTIFDEIYKHLQPYFIVYNMCMMKYIFGSVKYIVENINDVNKDDFQMCIADLQSIGINFNMSDIEIKTIDYIKYVYPLPEKDREYSDNYFVIRKTYEGIDIEDVSNLNTALLYILFCKQRVAIYKNIGAEFDDIKKANVLDTYIEPFEIETVVRVAKGYLDKLKRRY